jgi:hypothetical protein
MIDDRLIRFNDEYQCWSSFGKQDEEHGSHSQTEHQHFCDVQDEALVCQQVLPDVCPDVNEVSCHEN